MSRKKPEARCQECLMRREACICSLLPRLELSSRVVFVIGRREFRRPTNTGRLAAKCLSNSRVLLWGELSPRPATASHFMPESQGLLLYPHEDAAILTPEYLSQYKKPITLVVPDSNWRQTSKMRRRDPDLADLPLVKLPVSGCSGYEVRRETKAGGLATIEAVARALEVIEDSGSVRRDLEAVFEAVVTRTLQARGIVSSSEGRQGT